MATYTVTHEDGRTTTVLSDSSDEGRIKRQANHAETTRILIAEKRGHPIGPDASIAVKVEKVSD